MRGLPCAPSTLGPRRLHTHAHPLLPSLFVALSGKADTKRKPVGPRDGFVLPNVTAQTVTPLPYDILREGVKY